MGRFENIIECVDEIIMDVRDGSAIGEVRIPKAVRLIGSMHEVVEMRERDLIRALKWDDEGNPRRTWGEVAELLGYPSRQAMWARWHLLIAADRGESKLGRPSPKS